MKDPAYWGIQTRYLDHLKRERESPAASVDAVKELLSRGRDAHAPAPVRIVRATGRPYGYFERPHSDRTIVVPGHCVLPEGRTWGWSVQLYALRSSSSWGMGDLDDLARLGRWARELGADMLMVNPLSAGMPSIPQQTSPYFPSSRSFIDPLYISVDRVDGAERVDEQLALLRQQGRASNGSALIDRDRVYELKSKALALIWEGFRGDPAFERFRSERAPLLQLHATFACLVERFGDSWRRWPPEFRDPNGEAVRTFRETNAARVGFHEWLQWQAEEQLQRVRDELRVVQDIAVGVDPDGCDAWIWQDVFVSGATVGAPPDRFNTKGQDWGLPPFDPWALSARGFEPFIEMLRGGMRGGAVRIDHVMGMFRLWWIPEGRGPGEGVYVEYPSEALLDIVSLESHLNGAYVIGEDLGTVGPGVREELKTRGMLSYRLLLFNGADPKRFPRLSLGALTTHDLPTLAGLWTGSDLKEQRDLDLAPNVEETEAMRTMLRELAGEGVTDLQALAVPVYRRLASFDSAVVAVTMEDALGVEMRPNMPGTIDERANWRIPTPLSLESIQSDAGVLRLAQAMTTERPS